MDRSYKAHCDPMGVVHRATTFPELADPYLAHCWMLPAYYFTKLPLDRPVTCLWCVVRP